MALSGTIASNKDAAVTYAPVLLVSFAFSDGATFLNVSTHALSVAEGGYPYLGVNYLARVSAQDIQAIQIRSDQGIDRIPTVTLHLADADKVLFNNYEKTIGFKGAIVTLTLVLWEVDTANFSSDSAVKFVGVCDAPAFDQGCDSLIVTATSANNMGKASLPPIRIQQRCGNQFPTNAAQRKSGASDLSAWQWGCGYDPDQACTDPESGADARRGNTTSANQVDGYGRTISDSGGNYILCDYTKTSCVARGMYTKDSSGRQTGRYLGVQWAPVNTLSRSESYTSGKWVDILSSANATIYGDVYPLVYGTQWVVPKVANVLGDANSTRCEAMVCLGDVGTGSFPSPMNSPNAIVQVVVNGVIIPFNGSDPLLTWRYVNTGSRNGAPCTDALYDGNGDPYGSVATIEIVFYAVLGASSSVPSVMVLTAGPRIKVPNTTNPANQASWPYTQNANPAWCLLDALIWANWSYTQIDLQTFLTAAAISGVNIPYVNLTGGAATHQRYICGMAVDKRKTAAEVIQGMLQSFNAQLVRNNNSGLLQLYIRQGLADQQSSPVAGSNYNVAIQSVLATGALSTGYAAYLINEGSIARQKENGPSTLRAYKRPSADCPNRVTIGFQDADNSFASDSISMVDAADVARAGGYLQGNEIPANLMAFGISNFDQASRVCNVFLAESLRGNEAGDTRGTWYFDWVSTVKLEHLRVGHICLLQYQQLGLVPKVGLVAGGVGIPGILVRITRIAPSTDARTWTFTAQWHEDIWYTDLYGQQGAPNYSDPRKVVPTLPMRWMPNAQAPITGDSIYGATELTYGATPVFEVRADGSTIAELSITGVLPANVLTVGSTSVHPPLVGVQGLTASTGGTIAPGSYVIGVVATDPAGAVSPLSSLITVFVPAGTSTNTISTGTVNWMPNSSGYIVYAGRDSQHLSEQAAGSGTPSSFTITSLNLATAGPPDLACDHLVFHIKREYVAGTFGFPCTSVATGAIAFAGMTFTVNQFAGKSVSLAGRAAGNLGVIPVMDFLIVSNTATTLTVTPDPVASGALAGDAFIVRAYATIASASTIGDANFVGTYAPLGLIAGSQVGRRVRIRRGTGAGQVATVTANTSTTCTVTPVWATIPDATSWFTIEGSGVTTVPGAHGHNNNPNATPGVVQLLDINNYKSAAIAVIVNTATAAGVESLEPYSPIRDFYIWGAGETVQVITGNYTVQNSDQVLLCDSTIGPFSIQMPSGTVNGGRIVTIIKISADTNVITILPSSGEQVEFASTSTLVNQGDSAQLVGTPS